MTDPTEIEALARASFATLIADSIAAGQKAMIRFPQPNYVISKFAEESGEVVKAAIHCAEDRETFENVRGEIVQTIGMIYRLWVEGDQVHGLKPIMTGESSARRAEAKAEPVAGMTDDMPERIWAYEPEHGGVPRWGDWFDERSECPDDAVEYVRANARPAKLTAEQVSEATTRFWEHYNSASAGSVRDQAREGLRAVLHYLAGVAE